MGDQNLNLKIRITGDGSNLKAEVVGAESSIKQFGQQAEKSGQRASKAFSKTRTGVESISKQLNRMQGIATAAFAFVGLTSGIRSLIDMSDTFTSVNARLSLATRNAKEFTIAQQAMIDITRETRGQWSTTVDLYSRLARSTKELGVPQRDLLTVTKAINQAIVVSGTTSIEASNALIQLGQGMASGALRGDELRSVLEQMPRLAEMIAKGMGKSLGELRKMGEQGALTTEAVIAAIKKQAKVVNAEFERMPPTIAQASQQVANSFIQLWGDFTTTSGAATDLSSAILILADNLKAIATGALLVAKIAIVAYAGKVVAATLATNALTFSIAGLRAASLGLFMLYKSGGAKAVLAAPFIGMATATKAAFAGVTKLKLAGSLLFALWAGWEIGTYLSDRFAVVRQAGVALVAGLIKGWTYTKAAFELMGAGISIVWETMIAGLKKKLGGFIALTSRAIDKLPFTDGVAAGVKKYATQLQNAQGSLETFAAAQKRINDERDRTISQQDKILAAMFIDAGNEKTPPPSPLNTQGGGSNGLTAPVLLTEDPLKKLLASADSMTKQLSDKYKSSFQRISDSYSAMFDKLEALGKPGEARLEALSAAYDQFTKARWLKQEEERKAILSQGVDAIAESLLSENERRQQALDNRVAMLQQAQDDGLISEQRGLELRNQLHADYDQRLSDQKQQAMLDAEQNANDLKAQFAQIASSNQLVHLGAMLKNLESFGKSYKKIDKSTWSGKVQVAQLGMKMVSGLMESHNRKAFELGKAAAIADATVSTIVAVMKAWKDYTWPVGAALGVGIAAAGAINVAKIASTKMGGSASAGGIAGGSAPSVTGGASNVVALNPTTGIAQQPSFNPSLRQQPTTPSIQIVQHITAPNAQVGAADAIQTAANLGAQQALDAIGQDFASNGALRQQLA